MFATFRLGAVWVPTNFRLLPGEVVCLAQDSGAALFLCHADFPEHAAAVREAVPGIPVIRLGGQGGLRRRRYRRPDRRAQGRSGAGGGGRA